MGLRIVQVDAFTDRPFSGNPAAVCILPAPRDERWMQDVAREMNLSETAFLHAAGDGYALRWFTPVVEVALCGHATLASAHVLWQDGHLPADRTARFQTKSGLLTAERRGAWIEMDFPATLAQPTAPPPGMLAALGVANARYVGRNEFDYLIEVDGEATVRALTPDFTALGKAEARGVMVTSRAASRDYDYMSRFFAPAAGIDEDPVTGSAHACLGPYWSAKLGRPELVGYQASARGGIVRTHTRGDRVGLGGQAVTVLAGELV